jgi:hypothetical protein
MTPEEKRQGAFEEFDELLSEGTSIDAAIAKAAEDNELTPENFRVIAERHLGDLDSHRERIILRTEHDQFILVATAEVEKCQKREGRYQRIGFEREKAVIEAVIAALGRPITDHETWCIEEMVSPVVFQARQQIRFGIMPMKD